MESGACCWWAEPLSRVYSVELPIKHLQRQDQAGSHNDQGKWYKSPCLCSGHTGHDDNKDETHTRDHEPEAALLGIIGTEAENQGV